MSVMRKKKSTRLAVLAAAAVLTAASAVPQGALAAKASATAASAGSAASAAGVDAASPAAPAGKTGPDEKGGTPVNAAITKEKAAALARQYVGIPADYALQNASYNTNPLAAGKRGMWSLNFVKQANGKQKGSIHAAIDASDGGLLQYAVYQDDPGYKPSYPPKVNREQAVELVRKFIGQVGASYAGRVKADPEYGTNGNPPLTGETLHRIRFNRIVEGIPYRDNFIEAVLDGDGRVRQYNVNWDDTVTFGPSQASLTPEEAAAAFRKEARPYLAYVLPYQAEDPQPILAYAMDPFYLDAATGSRWNPGGGQPEPNTDKPVSDKPLAAAPAENRSLTAEEAAAAVKALFPIPAEAELTESNYSEYTNGRTGKVSARWNLGWSIQAGGGGRSVAWASVDSRSGVVRSYSGYGLNDWMAQSEAKPADYAAAREKAVDTVKRALPDLAAELYLQETDKARYEGKTAADIGAYHFRFQRMVDGAVVTYDSVSVSVSAATGEVQDYQGEINPFEYKADRAQPISKAQAIEAWMTFYRPELAWVRPYAADGQPLPIEKINLMIAAGELPPGGSGPAKLVYQLMAKPTEEAIVLDAVTGRWRELSTGAETELVKPKATDVEGHWARRELELMVSYKALDLKDGKVRPNAVVTRGELIKMLVLAMNAGRPPMPMAADAGSAKAAFTDVAADSSFFVYVETALQANLIDIGDGSFNPGGKVDREEMAELIVRALGYNSLAEHAELFNPSFADADKVARKGQAAIVTGLKIMTPIAGRFEPDREVTRAEAAAAFFRFLQARAELKEAPLRE